MQGIQTTTKEEQPVSELQGRFPVMQAFERAALALERLANHFDPPPPDRVGTPYVADRLGCTTDWIAIMVREEEIPRSCIVLGTGNGKPWKFHRSHIDRWIENR